MQLKHLIIGVLVVLAIFSFIAYVVIDHVKEKERIKIDFDFVVVEEGVGFNLDPDKLHFGSVCYNRCGASRRINLFNNEPFKEKVIFAVLSELDSNVGWWFVVKPSSEWIIEPHSSQDFNISLRVDNAITKKYEGKIIIFVYKAWPWEENKYLLEGCFSSDFQKILNCHQN